jgi:hypothetical protein
MYQKEKKSQISASDFRNSRVQANTCDVKLLH